MGVIANYLRYLVCRPIVSTFNSTCNFDRWIGSGLLIVDNRELCKLWFQSSKLELKCTCYTKGQSENCFLFKQLYNMPSQLYYLLDLECCLPFEHIIQLRYDMCFFGVHS